MRSLSRNPIDAVLRYTRLFDRRVRLLAIGQTVNAFGRSMAMPYLTIYFYTVRGFSFTEVGLGILASGLASMVGGLYAGAAADRLGRRPVMLASLGASSVALLAYAYVGSFTSYVLAQLFAGFVFSLYSPPARAMVADATPRDRRARAYGLLYMASNVGFAAGITAGGVLASAVPLRTVFPVSAVGSALFFFLVLLQVPETRARSAGTGSPGFAGLGGALTNRVFLLFVGTDVLFSICWSQFGSTFPVYLRTVVGIPYAGVGVLMGLNGVLVVLLQIPFSILAEQQRRTLLLAGSALALLGSFLVFWGLGNLAGTVGLPVLLGLGALGIGIMTLAEMLRSPVTPTLVADMAPADETGRYMSFLSLSVGVGSSIGPLLGGQFFDAGVPRLLWPAFGTLMLVAIAGLAVLGRRLPVAVNDPSSVVAAGPSTNLPLPGSTAK